MLEATVLLAAIASALVAVELRDLPRAVLAFALMSALVAAALYLAGAHVLAVFQLAIYAGAVSILMLAALHAGEEREER
jgi:NADH:ubiquinone oxidoreductase subunit 6 (subunit J)